MFAVGAVLMCRVKDTATDLYNALFETTGIDEALTDYGLLVVVKYWPGRVTRIYSARIVKRSPELMDHAQDKAGEWGVAILSFQLSDCRPTDETARLIQTSAQAAFKLDALTGTARTLGMSNVSELDSGLASVIVGAPLVAATNITVADTQQQAGVTASDALDSDDQT